MAVALAPPRRIVGVGWPANHLALKINVKSSYAGTVEACSGGTSDPVPTLGVASYLVNSTFDYVRAGNHLSAAYLVDGGGHTAIDETALTVSGMPSWPETQGYAPWTYYGDPGGGFPGSIWAEPAGADTGFAVPFSSRHFLEGASVDLSMQGFTFSTGPSCYHDTFTGLEYNYAEHASMLSTFGTYAFPVSAIVAIRDGKAYRGYARQIMQTVIDQPPDFPHSAIGQTPGDLWVLCLRSKVDDPAP